MLPENVIMKIAHFTYDPIFIFRFIKLNNK